MGLVNLVENYIEEVLSVKDITEEYTARMKRFDEDLSIEGSIYEIKMRVNCCGNKENVTRIWTKSEYEINTKRGYYLA